jgi:hypothetical protein
MSDEAEEGQDKRDDDDNSDNVKDAVHANSLLSIALRQSTRHECFCSADR